MLALLPNILHSYSLYSWINERNSFKSAGISPFCFCKAIKPGISAENNALFSMHCFITLFVANITTWLFILLLCAGDIKPNPGPLSVASSSGSSFSSNMSTDVFSHLNLNHNLSFVQYNVQSILNKLDILQAELFEIDILSFTETWLNPDIPTDDIMLQSYSTPERKDRPGDPHGGVIIYVKDGLFYKRRNDLEIRGIESIWIEVILNHKSILFGLIYRPPNADSQYFSNIEDSISLAMDTGISNIIVTGDFNLNIFNVQTKRKVDILCTQFSLHQPIDQPTHYTEHSSSLIDIMLVSNKDKLMFSGVGDPFINTRGAIPLPRLRNSEICKVKNKSFYEAYI